MRPVIAQRLAAAGIGILTGISLLTFGYARGASYLTDSPEACANCHVMNEQLSGWRKSSHRHAAVCNDCHAPAGFASKYATKALNGFFHSVAFTTGRFPDRIQITGRNRAVAEAACLKCHAGIVEPIRTAAAAAAHRGEPVHCLRCHQSVGH